MTGEWSDFFVLRKTKLTSGGNKLHLLEDFAEWYLSVIAAFISDGV